MNIKSLPLFILISSGLMNAQGTPLGRWEKVEALRSGTLVVVTLETGDRIEGTFVEGMQPRGGGRERVEQRDLDEVEDLARGRGEIPSLGDVEGNARSFEWPSGKVRVNSRDEPGDLGVVFHGVDRLRVVVESEQNLVAAPRPDYQNARFCHEMIGKRRGTPVEIGKRSWIAVVPGDRAGRVAIRKYRKLLRNRRRGVEAESRCMTQGHLLVLNHDELAERT